MPTKRQFLVLAAVSVLLLSSSADGQDPAPISDVPPAPVSATAPALVPVQEAPAATNTGVGPSPVILPAARVHAGGVVPGRTAIEEGPAAATTRINPSEYQRVYNSIPFNRAEYNVNPSYRHDATMEILTGTARHQTIVQHNHEHKQPVKRIPAPELPSRVIQPYYGFGIPRVYPYWFRGHVW
ncbi:MAG: hypothetical protein ACK58L_15305 [Planctomycetota bacterium]